LQQPSDSLAKKNSLIYSALPVIAFVVMGMIAGMVLSVLGSAFQKRSHHYGEILLVGALLIVPPFLFYHWAAFRQGLRDNLVPRCADVHRSRCSRGSRRAG